VPTTAAATTSADAGVADVSATQPFGEVLTPGNPCATTRAQVADFLATEDEQEQSNGPVA
jgi:hypothetical protein